MTKEHDFPGNNDMINYMVARFRKILETWLDATAPIEIVVYYDPKKRLFQIRPSQNYSETLDIRPDK